MSKLEKIFIRDLILFQTAKGKYIQGTIIRSPIVMISVMTTLEDENGDRTTIALYNMFPNCKELYKLANIKFPIGTKIKIVQPFYKIFADGSRGIRVDSPEEVIYVNEENFMSFDQLREKGKILVKSGDFTSALDLYFAHISRFNDAMLLLNNRAQSHLKLRQFEEALLDAAAVLFMDHGNKKARQRYESAVTGLGFDLRPNAIENASLWRKLLMLEWSLFVMETPPKVSREIGNNAFKEGKFTEAKEIYSAALSQFDNLVILLNNIAVVCLKAEMYQTAIAAASACLRITTKEEHRTKSCYSMTKAFSTLGEYQLAKLSAKNNPELEIFYNGDNHSFKVVNEALLNIRFNISNAAAVKNYLEQLKDEKLTGDYAKPNALDHCYISGKGRGVKAKEDLFMGELLLVDHPVISIEESSGSDIVMNMVMSPDDLYLKQRLLTATKYDGLLANKLLLLHTGSDQDLPLPLTELHWMAYHNLSADILPFLPQTPSEVGVDRSKLTLQFIENIIDTNVFSWGFNMLSERSALALRVSLLNHDYNPNCIHIPIGNVLVIVAKRSIKKGEELTIQYNEKEHMGKWGL